MGRWGSLLFEGNKRAKIPAYYVQVKSPFGAGDTYSGTLIACLMKGMKLADAARRASAAGSFAVEEKSTTPKLSWGKIEKRAALL
jgi:ribokinase